MATSLAENWDLPKVSKQEIYETKSSVFSFRKDYSIKTTDNTILLPHSQQPILLFNPKSLQKHKKKYKFLHIGLVQVGVKSLSHELDETSILLCLRDRRILDFDSSILSALESSLADGPLHFDYFPNIMLSLEDPNILQVLSLYVKFKNLEIKGTSFPFVLMYRIHYKLMPNPVNPAARKSSRMGETLFYQTMVRNPSFSRVTWISARRSCFGLTSYKRRTYRENRNLRSTVISWRDVPFPDEWKLPEEKPAE